MILLTQNELTMLLFTRIVGLGYLFNLVLTGAVQWTIFIVGSLTLITLTGYSCFLTIVLRARHDNAIQYY